MARIFLLVFTVLTLPAVSQAQLKVLMSGGFAVAYEAVLPQFEKTAGITVTTARGGSQGSGPATIGEQLRKGAQADLVILSREGLAELIADGRIIAGTDRDLARVNLGVAIRPGAPKPDLSTVDAFKRVLLGASSVTSPSSGGIYMQNTLFPRLGIAKEMSAKFTTTGLPAVVSGEAQIAIQPVSELLHARGAEFVGELPSEIQSPQLFAAAIVAGSRKTSEAKRLIEFLSSSQVASAIRDSGMEPAKSR